MLSLEQQNRLREQYSQEHPRWRPATEVYAALVRVRLGPHSRVLDLGCGRGGLVEQLSHPLHKIAGIDPDLTSLRQHRLSLPRAQAFSRRLPFPGECFDLAFASWLLEHLLDPAADLREVRRVLRPGAYFIFITPNAGHPLIGLNRLVSRLRGLQTALVQRLYGRQAADTFPAYYRANNREQLQQLAPQAGLRLSELRFVPDPTYLAFTPALFRIAQRLDALLPQERAVHLVGSFQRV
ncbi:MAG TPA: class I SAM-dependent methyltransferase [Candidatus Sulfomarinibacteraceae bacterium]|nr:class I SAM-dependent methyltransferase [Candidatus Sulfomarinibacteraceae bacterium]